MKNVALYVAITLMCLLILYSFVDMRTKNLEGFSVVPNIGAQNKSSNEREYIKPVDSTSQLPTTTPEVEVKNADEMSFSKNPSYLSTVLPNNKPDIVGIKKVLDSSSSVEYTEDPSMEKNSLYLSTVNSANIAFLKKRQFDDVVAIKTDLDKTNTRIDNINTRIDDITGGLKLNNNKL